MKIGAGQVLHSVAVATVRSIARTSALAATVVLASCGSSSAGSQGPSTTFQTASETLPSPVGPDTIAPPTSTPPSSSVAPTTATPTTAEPTTTTAPSLSPVSPYEPAETEVLKHRKRVGGQFAQALLTYEATATAESHAESLREQFGVLDDEGLVDLAAEAMSLGSQSVGTVRYVQMGGNRPTKASLMVWVDVEQLSPDGAVARESRVVDVRVEGVEDRWTVERLASAGGPAVVRPDNLSDLAASVVDDPRISMPDSARWDIYSGHTTAEMLQRMLEVAELTDYSVLVLSRGHPYRVFATESVSRHSVGQAMDVYEVGGIPVVDSRFEGSPTWTLAKTLFDDGIRSIGSPWAFDGFGGRSFTDDVHQDHLHITS